MSFIHNETLVSLDQLKKLLSDFRRKEKRTITNYIPDPANHKKWIESGNALVYYFDSSICIVHNDRNMLETIYISKEVEDLMRCLGYIRNDLNKPIVVEHVFREGKDQQIGIPNCLLRRMSRIGDFEEFKKPSKRVERAMLRDIPEINNIFCMHFNQYTERIPDDDELEKLIGMEGISVIREDGQIIGMVIYEKSASNNHLRYWWVSPYHRNKGIGADLLRDYFCSGHECRRQFLWVFSDNLNAIEKYRHYGFEFDGTADEIYVIK